MAIVLKNNLLCLNIGEPGKFYTGCRFDHTGNIIQVTMDEKWTFCTGEKTIGFDPHMHGRGFYNEFGINRAVGYDDCKAGQEFPKIGVGLLTRTDNNAYNFFNLYETKPFKAFFEFDTEKIRFTVLPEDCRGYSVKLVKTILLSGNSFSIEYELENTGIKRILTNEYCHNFISINFSPVDSHYSLTIPGLITDISGMDEAVNSENAVTLNTNTINFRFAAKKDFFFSPLTGFNGSRGEWILAHEGHGVAVKESTDFTPELMNLWGSGHVISPELFINIDIMPGETGKWRRKYEFYHL